MPLNLPLADRAGRGAIEQRIESIVKDMRKCGHGVDPEKFNQLGHLLDLERKKFHKLYGVKEHPAIAPIPER